MSRRCALTGKGVMTGNNVSHANNRTRRRFLPNLLARRLYSELLDETIRLRIAASTLRSIEKAGGIDGYLLGKAPSHLSGALLQVRKRMAAAQEARKTA
jgi:large subunit ribosomal protein L28